MDTEELEALHKLVAQTIEKKKEEERARRAREKRKNALEFFEKALVADGAPAALAGIVQGAGAEAGVLARLALAMATVCAREYSKSQLMHALGSTNVVDLVENPVVAFHQTLVEHGWCKPFAAAGPAKPESLERKRKAGDEPENPEPEPAPARLAKRERMAPPPWMAENEEPGSPSLLDTETQALGHADETLALAGTDEDECEGQALFDPADVNADLGEL